MSSQTKGAHVLPDTVFHITLFGNFSGRHRPYEDLSTLPLSSNNWDTLFDELKPSVRHTTSLDNTDDLSQELVFASLRDFGRGVPLEILKAVDALDKAVENASEDRVVKPAELLAAHPSLATLRQMAESGGEDKVIDLLAMVDIGEEDSGPNLPKLKAFFAAADYAGDGKKALRIELAGIRTAILAQLGKNKAFNRLHGLWRGLKLLLPYTRRRDGGPLIKVEIFDSRPEDWCDLMFLNYVKPENGDPKPLDLAVFVDPISNHEDDHHRLFHLGRMAAAVRVPFIMETDPGLFGVRTWSLLGHVADISGKLNGPTHIKWRKLREEPGSEWLFLAANPFRVRPGDEEGETDPTAPAAFLPSLIMLEKLADGLWPSEMLGSWSRIEAPGRPLAPLTENQHADLAYEGLMGVTASEQGEYLMLGGITCLGTIKIPARDQSNPANVLPYTLPYRFYSGSCSRFISGVESSDLSSALVRFAGLKSEEDLTHEQEDGVHFLRLQAPFTILGVHPELILTLQHE